MVFTSARESRPGPQNAPAPPHFRAPSPRNNFFSLGRNQLSLSLKLEVSSDLFWWGNKMYLSFPPRGPGRADGAYFTIKPK